MVGIHSRRCLLYKPCLDAFAPIVMDKYPSACRLELSCLPAVVFSTHMLTLSRLLPFFSSKLSGRCQNVLNHSVPWHNHNPPLHMRFMFDTNVYTLFGIAPLINVGDLFVFFHPCCIGPVIGISTHYPCITSIFRLHSYFSQPSGRVTHIIGWFAKKKHFNFTRYEIKPASFVCWKPADLASLRLIRYCHLSPEFQPEIGLV